MSKENIGKSKDYLMYFLIPVLQMIMFESFYKSIDFNFAGYIINAFFFYGLYFLVILFSKNKGIPILVTTPIWYAYGLINCAVYQFRQIPVLPWDILSLKTAMNVAGSYHFKFTPRMLAVTFLFITIMTMGVILVGDSFDVSYRKIKKNLSGAGTSLCCILFSVCVLVSPLHSAFGLYDAMFYPNEYYSRNGYVYSFFKNLTSSKIEKPKEYSKEESELILSRQKTHSGDNKTPNVIVIMNEAFSDLSTLSNRLNSFDYMPYITSLKDTENSTVGTAFTSVKGGNTANSEWEFLTGNTMAFMPAGSVPYQQFINRDIKNSLVNILKKNNYETYAFHPYYKSGWNREKVYKYMGFDHQKFGEDCVNTVTKEDVIRGMMSDNGAYNDIIKTYENRNKNKGFFEFCVTMQNHGGYDAETNGAYKPDITFDNEKLSTYLSLIKKSDAAFKNLTEYFKSKEPTIIVMFGDHQPADDVVETLTSDGTKKVSNYMRYKVPYVVWANYNISKSNFNTETSLNYLGSSLLDTANLTYDGYFSYLNRLKTKIPVITANTVKFNDKTGTINNNIYQPNKVNNVDFDEYKKLQYYCVKESP